MLVVELRDRVRPALAWWMVRARLAVLGEGRLAVPYTSDVEVMTRSASSSTATSHAALTPATLTSSVERAPAEARDLLRREVHDRAAAGERRPQRRADPCSRAPRTRTTVLDERRQVRDRAVRQVVDARRPCSRSASSRSHTCEPMNPAAPVTPTLHRDLLLSQTSSARGGDPAPVLNVVSRSKFSAIQAASSGRTSRRTSRVP